jgi:DNA-binding MarR family transcriptional regulator
MASTHTKSALDDLPLYLPRVYYAFLGLVEHQLVRFGLDTHLAPGMGHILLFLYERDECIIKEISDSIRISQTSLTGLIRRMQKAGLIHCRRCEQDGRAVRVSVTDLGLSLKPRLLSFHHSVTTQVQRGLSAAEVAEAKRVLAIILENLRGDETADAPKASPKIRSVKKQPVR